MGQAPMLQRTGDGPMTATAYVRLYVQREGDVPGTYTANLPITLRYGVVNGGFANCNALGSNAAGPAAFGSGSTAAIPTLPANVKRSAGLRRQRWQLSPWFR